MSTSNQRRLWVHAILSLCCLVTLAVSPAVHGVVINEDWEGNLDGDVPSSPWVVVKPVAPGVTLEVDAGVNSDFTSGSNALHIEDASTTANLSVALPLGGTTDALTITFDVMNPSPVGGDNRSILFGVNGLELGSLEQGALVLFNDGGTTGDLYWNDFNSFPFVAGAIDRDTWYRVTIQMDPIPVTGFATWSLEVQEWNGTSGTVIVSETGLGVRNAIDSYDELLFAVPTSSGSGSFQAKLYLDNVNIVPEPSSLALMAVAGCLMMSRRKSPTI